MPELHNLRAFVAVAEQLSFTRAAETLHLRQQTVSQSVQDLERELGVILLERTTREVRLTPAGTGLLKDAREVIRHAEAAFAHARAVGTGRLGTVTVGLTPAIGPSDRADLIKALRDDQPELSIALRDVRPGDLHLSLRNHTVDFVLTRSRRNNDPAIHQAELRPTPVEIYVPEGHPLTRRSLARIPDLDGETLLCASPPGTPYTDMLLARLKERGATVTPVEARITGGSALLTEVVRLEAIALEPVGTTPPPGVVSVPLDGFTLPLLVLWPAGLPPPALERVRSHLSVSQAHRSRTQPLTERRRSGSGAPR